MSDTVESFKDLQTQIHHLARDGASRFPKLDECAHFHYDHVELGPVEVVLCEEGTGHSSSSVGEEGEWCVRVSSNGVSWEIRRTAAHFQMLDRQLHRCVYDRKFSRLQELQPDITQDALRTMLTQYLERFSHLAGSLINCGTVLNWLELDNRGNRLIVTDEAAINTPAVAAAYVIKRYASQAADEISFEVGDIISVIDMPPPAESTWWRGKKGFQVGFFPCECVEIIGDKVPQSFKIPKTSPKPILRRHGKLIAFFRSFLLSRPSRRKLKQSGILKERVFGCDLGEHLQNTARDIPLVLKCCSEFIEEHGIVDGIYRLSGVTSNIQKLRVAFDEDRVPNLTDECILQDIHCVASLLKMYFRELPNPLLTFHLYDKFVSAVQAPEELRLLRLRDVVQQLPPPHYRSLEYLMRHLSRVAGHGQHTGMTPKNVAIVWAPNLLRDLENGGAVGALHVVGVQAVLTEYLIRYTDIIFSEKMPLFPSPTLSEDTPKKRRPKSLAISTPTRLLSLEEARSRALTSHKYIDVGGGEENLPIKYHTVLELPARRKGKKSPSSSWRSFFTRATSGRRRKERQRMRGAAANFTGDNMQDKAVTESDVPRTHSKKLRTVKSAENLFPFHVEHPIAQYAFSPLEENIHSPDESAETSLPNAVPSCTGHARSTSHDSYFERTVEYVGLQRTCSHNNTTESTSAAVPQPVLLWQNVSSEEGREESPAKRSKLSHPPLVPGFETEDSSPAPQKLNLKRLHHTLSSPPTEKRKGFIAQEVAEGFDRKDYLSLWQPSEVPLSSNACHSSSESQRATHSSLDTASIEVHKEEEGEAEEDCDGAHRPDSTSAMLSQSTPLYLSLSTPSQPLSFTSDQKSPGVALDVSVTTSTTDDDVSRAQSCAGTVDDNPALNRTLLMKDFVLVQNEHAQREWVEDESLRVLAEITPKSDAISLDPKEDEQLVHQTRHLYINSIENESLRGIVSPSLEVVLSPVSQATSQDSPLVGDIILSPPASFVDERKETKGGDDSMTRKVTNTRSMERSKTEIHDICSKFMTGIAVSGSFAQELFRANTDSAEVGSFHKKRSCSDKLSPMSPVEDTKRRFESEIGRLIVRDRQMRLEMEQMKAERQRQKPPSPQGANKKRNESRFADVLDFRNSPLKSHDREKRKLEIGDVFKSPRESSEEKKTRDIASRFANKPSVRELLSKFESPKKGDDSLQKTNLLTKQSTGLFSNVQVINHNFPLTYSKSFASHFSDSEHFKDTELSKEHIFQTECVIRFPHPKSSIVHQDSDNSPKNSLSNWDSGYDSIGSNSWTQRDQGRDPAKTTFLSSSFSQGSSSEVNHLPEHRSMTDESSGKASVSLTHDDSGESKRTMDSSSKYESLHRDSANGAFSTFQEAFNRANRVTNQMRNEFLQRGLPQDPSPFAQSTFRDYGTGSPPVNRRRPPPTRQRPKSVPPPISRLSYATEKPSTTQVSTCLRSTNVPGNQSLAQTPSFLQDQPLETSGHSQTPEMSNGSPYSSQGGASQCGVRERAAIFERSMSFSGRANTLASSPKAQRGSLGR